MKDDSNDDDDVNNYYEDHDEEEDEEPQPKQGKNVKHVKNEHYDLAYDVNESLEKSQQNPIKKEESSDEESREEIRNNNPAIVNQIKQLPKFDITEFYNLNPTGEMKELLMLMTK